MRIVLLSESPEADSLAEGFVEAAEEFNRTLDIRLRFLDVGFTLRPFPVGGDDPAAPVRLEAMLRSFQPGVVLVLGRGPLLLECTAAAVKGGAPVAYLLDGSPDRFAAAILHLASVVMIPGGMEPPSLRPGVARHTLPAPEADGPGLVDALVRSVRENPGT